MYKPKIQEKYQCILEMLSQAGMKDFGYGKGYKYPHDYPAHVVEQQYLPDEMLGTKYYIKDDTVE